MSVVGRFLEHSRVYYFENGGQPEAFIGSADMMRRNLDRRVEVLVPVQDAGQIEYLIEDVIGAPLMDNVRAWECLPDGSYRKITQEEGQHSYSSQDELMKKPATKVLPLA